MYLFVLTKKTDKHAYKLGSTATKLPRTEINPEKNDDDVNIIITKCFTDL